MVSFITTSNNFVFSFSSIGNCTNFPILGFMIHPRRQQALSFNLIVTKESRGLRFSGSESSLLRSPIVLLQRSGSSSGLIRRWCKGWESHGDDFALEAEILEFMQKSKNPTVFPTRKELTDAGKMDLVDAIVKQGGWLSLGWDLDVEDTVQQNDSWDSNSVMAKKCDGDDDFLNGDSRMFQQRFDGSCTEPDSLEGNVVGNSEASSSTASSSYPASPSGRSIELEGRENTGIEGILNRLEKERSLAFGVDWREKEGSSRVWRNNDGNEWQQGISTAVADREKSSSSTSLSPSKVSLNDSRGIHIQSRSSSDFDGRRSSLKPDMWRTWSIQRAGFSDTEFEAAEIITSENKEGRVMNAMDDGTFTMAMGANEERNIGKELNSGDKENEYDQIRSRLQHMELELASVLDLLRSRSDAIASHKGPQSSSEELQKLSDAWEFQETEIMNTQDKLRSTRAKLAVLEGKMALAIIEAQKIVEEKQKRIDDARTALRLLRTTCIIWPNPASEVLLAGSFDGWTSQRKMERSTAGIFSLCLKLYPGRYEIKFIVDGVWMIDPLRPIIDNNGHTNNLLTVS